MYFDPISRRFFLRGLGASLILPFLPSVMSHAQGAAYRRRYVQVISPFGQFPSRFWPSDSNMQLVEGVHVKALSSINGDISRVIGPAFNPWKDKVSIVRGLNVLAGSGLHNGSYGSCASGTYTDNHHNGPPVFPWSVDAVMSQSSKIYPDSMGKERFVNFAPRDGSYSNFSWWRNNGRIEHLPVTHNTQSLYAKFTQLGQDSMAAQDPRRIRKQRVMDEVFEQYKNLRDSRRISAECKQRLEAFTTTISELENDLNSAQGPSCSKPMLADENSLDAKHRNQIKILVAALSCGLTNVASYCIAFGYEPMHSWAHNNSTFAMNSHADNHRKAGEWFTYLLSEMDKMPDIDGTLLDNSIVYWGNEFGDLVPGDKHTNNNMQVVLAGGGAGTLRHGYFVDFEKTGGRPLNNLLVTLFNAMGLSSSEYQRENVAGFGEYNGGAIKRFRAQKYVTNEERRKPLPFIYTGPQLG